MTKKTVLCYLGLACLLSNCSSDPSDSDEIMEEVILQELRTLIPRPAFKNTLIELNIDDMADGSANTANIANVSSCYERQRYF